MFKAKDAVVAKDAVPAKFPLKLEVIAVTVKESTDIKEALIKVRLLPETGSMLFTYRVLILNYFKY